jgi:hypothetical protein
LDRQSDPLAILVLLAWITLAASGCVTPVHAAGSPTPGLTQTTAVSATPEPSPTPQPSPTPTSSPTALPSPVCTIAWAWRDAGLTIVSVDFSRADGLAPGDLILAINGRDAEAVIAEIETGLGGVGDPALRRALALDALLYGSDVLVLLVRHAQQPAYYYNLVPACHL